MDDYEFRDWCYNCINLSEYYTENGYFAQAEYLLLVGMSIVPEDDTNKLKATFQMTLGKVHLEMLNFCTSAQIDEKHIALANEKLVTFETVEGKLDQKFPTVTISNDMNVCKSLFRKANTQFKRSM